MHTISYHTLPVELMLTMRRFILSMKDRRSTLFKVLVVLLYIRRQSLGIAANHIYTNLHIYVIDMFEKIY